MGRFPFHNFVQDPETVRLVLNSKQEKAISQQSIIRILAVDDFASWRRFVSTIAQTEPALRGILSRLLGVSLRLPRLRKKLETPFFNFQ